MRALGRPVFGWTNDATDFATRTRAGTPGAVDAEGLLIEDFGLADNLMIEGAIQASGGSLTKGSCPPANRWTDLDAFEACVRTL